MILRVLVAAKDADLGRRLSSHLADLQTDLLIRKASSLEALWKGLRAEPFDLILCQRTLLGPDTWRAIEELRSLPEAPEVLLFVEDAQEGDRTEDLAAGALAVLDQRIDDPALREVLATLVERRRDQAVTELRAEEGSPESHLSDFASTSPAMRRFLSTVRKVVHADSSLLLLGETGVGKEYLARAIHSDSHRSEGPFVAVNCGALPEALLESELFGHVAGAFTGAQKARRGYFELAHGGTLFLDEIGEVAPHLQVKLLRVLQEREIRPVGSEKAIRVDVRVLAATNRDLRTDMDAGRFRADLYYRLGVVTLTVPPLRERREDIPRLAESHVEHFRRTVNRPVYEITPEAMERLVMYSWPGNVRELINVIERSVLLASGEEITLEDLPEEIVGGRESVGQGGSTSHPLDAVSSDRSYREARDDVLDAFDRRYFEALLTETHGKVGEAAERAGITARALYEKMRRLGLRKENFRGKEKAGSREGGSR